MITLNFRYKPVILLLIIIILFASCNKLPTVTNGENPPQLTYLTNTVIRVTFSTVPDNINLTIPPLKYNKDFCIGFHLDDGAKDIYTHAFPFLNGGIIDGVSYSGLVFTDGCGNDINFKMSTAIYSFDVDQLTDIHDPTQNNYFITWEELNELYQNGWGIYNHGLTADYTIDPAFSIVSNHNYVKSKITDVIDEGIDMKIFVNPEGDLSYTDPAFQQNYRISFVASYPLFNKYSDISVPWAKNNIRMGRTLLIPNESLSDLADEIAVRSINGAHYWGSTFNHSITNENYGYSFDMFKNHMLYISNTYGKNGLDNIWMVSEEETLDYSILRDELIISESLIDNTLEITFSGNIPNDLRFFNTSLILTANTNITSIVIENASQSSSFNGINTNTSLININCDKL